MENVTSKLYTEEDILRNAAEKNFKVKGFDRKTYRDVINPKKEMLSDSAIRPSLPACYYSLGDSFSGSGSLPAPPGGEYYQMGDKNQSSKKRSFTNLFSYMIEGLVAGLKDGVYRAITQRDLILRDYIMTKANSMGKIPNFISSIYAMGADIGPVIRMIDDSCDRMEILVDQYSNVLAYRTYNTRKPTRLIRWLRKEAVKEGAPVIPRMGRAVEFDDLDFTMEGQ
ncbi:MAG: hypothetical protein QW286_01275, partial [Candidatus Aenigmatarchaeota archaeon]